MTITIRSAIEGGPHVPYLSASRSKRDFFERLSLSEESDDHVALYDLMKACYALLLLFKAKTSRKKRLLEEIA